MLGVSVIRVKSMISSYCQSYRYSTCSNHLLNLILASLIAMIGVLAITGKNKSPELLIGAHGFSLIYSNF